MGGCQDERTQTASSGKRGNALPIIAPLRTLCHAQPTECVGKHHRRSHPSIDFQLITRIKAKLKKPMRCAGLLLAQSHYPPNCVPPLFLRNLGAIPPAAARNTILRQQQRPNTCTLQKQSFIDVQNHINTCHHSPNTVRQQ